MNITLVGLGVIGGSIGLSLRGKIYGVNVFGIDLNSETIEKAFELGIIEEGAISDTSEADELISSSDIIILSIYPEDIKIFMNKYKDCFKENTIVIDTSGVKNKVVNLEIPKNVDFVLVHPMAGREKKGIEFASRKVFIGANFIITKTPNNKDENIEQVKYLAQKMGFTNVVETTVETHDDIIAFTSQLPHAIAVALVNSDNLTINTGSFTGDSYKEITRIANINEILWSQLFLSNKENLLTKIECFEKSLDQIKNALKNEDEKILKELFVNAAEKRKKL
ncbi:MAG: prephenate dehydrogenase [Sarcina sp.]